jgi:hypothetical protein
MVMALATQQLLSESGLRDGLDPKMFRDQLAPTLRNAQANTLFNWNTEARKAEQETNRSIHIDEATAEIAGSPQTAANQTSIYQSLVQRLQTTGLSRGKAADVAFETLVDTHTANKDVDALENLKEVQRVSGQGGLKFGVIKRKAIEDAIEAIETDTIQDNQRRRGLIEVDRYETTVNYQQELREAAGDPVKTEEVNRKYHKVFQQMPDGAGLDSARAIAEDGFVDNVFVYDALYASIQAEDDGLTQADIDQAFEEKTITAKQYGELSKALNGTPASFEGEVKAYNTPISRAANGIAGVLSDKLGVGMGDPAWDAESGLIRSNLEARLKGDLREFLADAAASGTAPTNGQITSFLDQRAQAINAELTEQIKAADEAGKEYKYQYYGANNLETSKGNTPRVDNTTGRTFRNLTGLTTQDYKSFDNKDKDRSNDINPVNDRVLTSQELLAGMDAYQSGKPIPPRVATVAEALGLSPRVLLQQQAMGRGFDVTPFEVERKPLPAPNAPDYKRAVETQRISSDATATSAQKGRALAYRTGNVGPTSTGQHLDIKQVGGGRFTLDELTPFLEVDDPDHGTISTADLRHKTGYVGDSFQEHVNRGSHGIDVGTYSGTLVYVKGGARVVSSVPSAHGAITTIQLPDGRRFTLLHGYAV